MNCHACGFALRSGARFCGQCGVEVPGAKPASAEAEAAPPVAEKVAEVAAVPALASPQEPLLAALRQLANALEKSQLPRALVHAAHAVAAGPAADRHTTVILGDHRRGKTTLLNRLLGQQVMAPGGTQRTFRYYPAAQWRVRGDGIVAGPPFALNGEQAGDQPCAIEGPAPLLRCTSLLDTPPLNSLDQDLEMKTLRQALAADLVILCLHAEQLLSDKERRLVREQLVPLTTCSVVLAVTHLDRVSGDDDRRELESRVQRFVERVTPAGRLQAAFLAGSAKAETPVAELEQTIRILAEKATQNQVEAWTTRTAALLKAVEPLAAEPTPAAPPSEPPHTQDVEALLRGEHEIALREASSQLRAGLADLRLSIAARFEGLTPEQMQREGMAQLTGEVQTLGKEAARAYVESLRRSLAGDGPAALSATVQSLDPRAAGALNAALAAPNLKPMAKAPRDWTMLTLTGAGIALLALSTAWIPMVGGALVLVGANQLRRNRKADRAEDSRTEAIALGQDWLTSVEPALIDRLKAEADSIFAELKQMLEPTPEPARIEETPAPEPTDLHAAWTHCQQAWNAYHAKGETP